MAIAFGQEPERDHRREVEGRDRGDDPDRLAHQLDVDPAGGALEVLALHQVGHRGRRLHRLDPAADLAAGVVERLAHVLGDQPGELVAVGDEGVAEVEHGAGPLRRRDLAPRRLRLGGAADGRLDVGAARERDPRQHLARRRVEVLEGLRRARLDPGCRRRSCAGSGASRCGRAAMVFSLRLRSPRSASDRRGVRPAPVPAAQSNCEQGRRRLLPRPALAAALCASDHLRVALLAAGSRRRPARASACRCRPGRRAPASPGSSGPSGPASIVFS